MKRLPVLLLTALLAGQLALALSFVLTGSDHAVFAAKEPLLAFEPAKIDRIAIDDDAGNSVVLERHDGKWVIPSFSDFPASQAGVETLLSQLAALKKGWPVAETQAAAERFKLTDKLHDRRVVLTSGGKKVGELLIGTSPSFRQVHARVADAAAIYTVEFAEYDAGASADAWMDRDALDTPRDKIASITVGDVTIDGKDGKFTLAGLTKDDKPLPDKIDALVSAIAHPMFDAVQGKGKDALTRADNPEITVALKRTDGGSVTYRYRKEATGDGYVFASSAQDYLFHVKNDSIAPIVQAKRAALIDVPKPDAKPDNPSETKAEPAPQAPAGPQGTPGGHDTQAAHGAESPKEPGG